ncbi:MAG: transcription antitermination factor NusB [Roseibacillus sp.]
MTDKNVRRAAVSALRAWSKGHVYAEALVDRHSRRNNLSTADRGLLNSILLAVLRNRSLLDHWIGMLRKGRLDHETRDVLRVGVCQLLILGIPDHAAVNETVACARSPVRGLINAVLRRAVSARKTLFSERDKLSASVNFSHPDWLYNGWCKQFGKEDTLALLEWNNQPAPTILRLNSRAAAPLDPTTCEVLSETTIEGYYELDGPIPADWIEQGLVYVQDPSTRHAVDLLSPRPGETILDACAAPGGKSSLIAAAMNNEGDLLCTDLNERRLPRLAENLQRQQISIAGMATFDWTTEPPPEWNQRFDGILLDVPCSNTGVLRRRVDARWRLQPDQIESLVETQRRIFMNAVPCLKPGGRLVYSTCSLEPEENKTLIGAMVAAHPRLKLLDSRSSLPFRDGFDGSYAALLGPGT